ncbi:hypothetical protein GGQ99_003302 [Aminobacter niigataensis]|uniref:Uncharacterized protein n=1 Tax=Aminobacter niigataensis TaxID=83265 RepID=A0ABR6L466_9HYPH|nr:hypothetical protein [Aminobacter niigataensis]
MLGKVGCALQDAGAFAAPCCIDGVEYLDDARTPVARLTRKIGPAPERLGVRREKHRQRPASLLAHAGERCHVYLVDVGPLLAVDLDVNEEPVHDLSNFGILEAFVRHDMAPMAGGITDGEQDGPVQLHGFRQSRR